MVEEESLEWLNRPREVLIRGVPNGKICPPGMDYCWQCGHIALYEEFVNNNQCPNPECPNPKVWND